MLRLCKGHAAARVRSPVCARSPLQQYKKVSSFIRAEEASEHSHQINDLSLNRYLPEPKRDNRVMILVDLNDETEGALEWALSHTVQSQDSIVLLHVARKDRKTNNEIDQRAYDLLQATKVTCQLRRPEVRVEIAIREGNKKGAVIVEAADQLSISLLVLGQRNPSLLWDLRNWMRKRTWSRVVDYCIQNANCTAVAVRKNRKSGGYLITTKHHKNFWLLA